MRSTAAAAADAKHHRRRRASIAPSKVLHCCLKCRQHQQQHQHMAFDLALNDYAVQSMDESARPVLPVHLSHLFLQCLLLRCHFGAFLKKKKDSAMRGHYHRQRLRLQRHHCPLLSTTVHCQLFYFSIERSNLFTLLMLCYVQLVPTSAAATLVAWWRRMPMKCQCKGSFSPSHF